MGRIDKIKSFLDIALRHDPEKFNLKLYDNYKCNISDILNFKIEFDELIDFLDSNKNEFIYSLKEGWVAAKSGHTYIIPETLETITPPPLLFFSYQKHKDNDFIFSGFDLKYPSKGGEYCRLYKTFNEALLSKKYLADNLIVITLDTKKLINHFKDIYFYLIDKEIFSNDKQDFIKIKNEKDIAIKAIKLKDFNFFYDKKDVSFSEVISI